MLLDKRPYLVYNAYHLLHLNFALFELLGHGVFTLLEQSHQLAILVLQEFVLLYELFLFCRGGLYSICTDRGLQIFASKSGCILGRTTLLDSDTLLRVISVDLSASFSLRLGGISRVSHI